MEPVVLCCFTKRTGPCWRRCWDWKPAHLLPVGLGPSRRSWGDPCDFVQKTHGGSQFQLSFTMNLGACLAVTQRGNSSLRLCSLNMEKPQCIGLPCVLAPNAFPQLARCVQESPVPGKQTLFLLFLAQWDQLMWQHYMCPLCPENMGETLAAQAEDTKGMDAHTPVCMYSSSHQRDLQFHGIMFSSSHFKGSWLINRNKPYLGDASKWKWRWKHSPQVIQGALSKTKKKKKASTIPLKNWNNKKMYKKRPELARQHVILVCFGFTWSWSLMLLRHVDSVVVFIQWQWSFQAGDWISGFLPLQSVGQSPSRLGTKIFHIMHVMQLTNWGALGGWKSERILKNRSDA